MASLKNIKLKIQSVKKTSTVTRAMEAVSAVKMRKSQERALSGRSYAAAGLSILERHAGTADMAQHPLMNNSGGNALGSLKASPQEFKTCIIIVTSDKGLAGSLNSAVIRKTEAELQKRQLTTSDVVMIGIGRRGADYFANRGWDVRVKHENLSDGVSESDLRVVTDAVLAWHAAGEVGSCFVVYTNFISTFEQEAVVRQVVPITPEGTHTMVEGIRPARGKYAPSVSSVKEAPPAAYIIEPDADVVLATLLPKLLNIAIFHTLLEAKASEHSARMVDMKNATDNAKERAKQYTRTFNKIRQAAITREISEIVGGIEAMR